MATYSAKSIHIVYGPVLVSGYAPDSFVEIAYNNPQWNLTVGSGGEFIRSQSSDNSAKVTISLLQSSASNAALLALYATDSATRKGALPLVITNIDELPPTVFTATGAWISKLPDRTYGSDASSGIVKWEFETGSLISVYGLDVSTP